MLRTLLLLLGGLLTACAVAPMETEPVAAQTAATGQSIRLTVSGPDHLVYSAATGRCDNMDLPDAPLRPVRNINGEFIVFGSGIVNRLLRGPGLDSLRHDCAVAYRGRDTRNPAEFDSATWLISPWTPDGRTVYALAHNEFEAYRFGDMCQANPRSSCWWNSVLLLKSVDGGRTYRRAGPNPLVAAPAHPYRPDQKQPVGFFSPANIIYKDGAWYSLFGVGPDGPQRRGACLFRSTNIADPASWRAFDGRDFTLAETSPYQAGRNPQPCATVGPFIGPVRSVVRQAGTGLFIALMTRRNPARPDQDEVVYTVSRDLIHWSDAQHLLEILMPDRKDCDTLYRYAYPSLVDPASPSANYDTVGNTARLYMVRMGTSPKHCMRVETDRSVVWRQVTISAGG